MINDEDEATEKDSDYIKGLLVILLIAAEKKEDIVKLLIFLIRQNK